MQTYYQSFKQPLCAARSMLLIIIILIVSSSIAHAQNIPNGGFESWSLVSGANNPDSWQTNVLQPSDSIYPIQVNDNIEGNFAILFQTKYVNLAGAIASSASNKFAIASKPNYFNGYYKSLRTGAGAAVIKVTLKNDGIVIGTVLLNINTNINSYTSFTLPITYTSTLIPNEAIIWLASDGISNIVLGNRLWVDNLSFSALPLSAENELEELSKVRIYPNPANDVLNIEFSNNMQGVMELYNLVGELLLEKQIVIGKNTINTHFLNDGIYILEIRTEQKSSTYKFIKD